MMDARILYLIAQADDMACQLTDLLGPDSTAAYDAAREKIANFLPKLIKTSKASALTKEDRLRLEEMLAFFRKTDWGSAHFLEKALNALDAAEAERDRQSAAADMIAQERDAFKDARDRSQA